MPSARVFVIGRKSMCIEGLVAILGQSPDIEIAGRATEWSDGLSRVAALAPDVVIVDLVHCDECGPAAPTSCVRDLEGYPVIVVGLPDSDPGIIDAFEAGALGFLTLSGQSAEEIRRIVHTVAAGEAALDPRLSASILARMRKLSRSAAGAPARDLAPTDREHDVLDLLVAGKSNREIAMELHVSESTVKNHLHALYAKLGVESRSQAISEAIRRGLATP